MKPWKHVYLFFCSFILIWSTFYFILLIAFIYDLHINMNFGKPCVFSYKISENEHWMSKKRDTCFQCFHLRMQNLKVYNCLWSNAKLFRDSFIMLWVLWKGFYPYTLFDSSLSIHSSVHNQLIERFSGY